MTHGLWGGAAVVLWMVTAHEAVAQEIPPNVGSADRPRPEYDPTGIRFGSIFVYPSLGVQAVYDDNIFASKTGKITDESMQIRPEISLNSDWSSHAISADIYSETNIFAKNSSENLTDYSAHAGGRLDIQRTTYLQVSGEFDRLHVDRGNIDTPFQTVHPIRYVYALAHAELHHQLNRLSFRLSGQFTRFDYRDGVNVVGNVIDQDFRDRDEFDVGLRIAYEISPGYSGFVQIDRNKRTYDLGPNSPQFNPATDLDRSSKGLTAEAGIAFEISRLLYGNIRVGYLSQNYRSTSILDDKGLSFGAGLLWNVTTLTSVRINVDRRAEDTTSTISAGRLTTEISIGIDHELLRNLIITLEGGYANYNYQGISRSDDYVRGEGKIRYLLNRHVSAEVGYQYTSQSSEVPFLNYSRNLARIGLTFSP